jgi:two-component system cell cycle response regulator CtrA
MRLLIIEDEDFIACRIKSACVADGIVCHIANNGNDGMEMLYFQDYDIAILDLMLPDMNGFNVLDQIKQMKKNVPVVVLSGLDSIDNKIKCLSNGADDYLTKPFDKMELLARVHAVTRRSRGVCSSIVDIGPLSLNFVSRTVSVCGMEIPLTSKEYSTLELLVLRKGSIITKEAFLNHIYGGMDEPDLKIVDVFICKLRRKMADASGGLNLIDTIWGRGYTIKEHTVDDTDSKNTKELKVS